MKNVNLERNISLDEKIAYQNLKNYDNPELFIGFQKTP